MTLFFVFCLFLLISLLAGASYWQYEVFTVLIIALLTLITVSLFEIIYLKKRLLIDRLETSREIVRGERATFVVKLSLGSRWLPAQLSFTARYGKTDKSIGEQSHTLIYDLRPGEEATLRTFVTGRHVGALALDGLTAEMRGFLGLFKYQKNLLLANEAAEILVLPQLYGDKCDHVSDFRHIVESEQQRRRVHERSDEIDTMRNFQEGDEMRSIHWPISARIGTLVTKEYEAPVSIRTHLIFDDFSGYSLCKERDQCERALRLRDSILDAVASNIDRLLSIDRTLELYLGVQQTARERQSAKRDSLNYRRLLASLPLDSMPTLVESLGTHRQFGEKDSCVLFSARLSEASAAAVVRLSRDVSQVVFYYFEPPEISREEDFALWMIRQSSVTLIRIPPELHNLAKE